MKYEIINTEALKRLRMQTGLTQHEMAQKIDTTTNYYGKIERGDTIPSLKMIVKIAKVLNAKTAEFLAV